mgnify:CR=1 FL=1
MGLPLGRGIGQSLSFLAVMASDQRPLAFSPIKIGITDDLGGCESVCLY